MPEKLHFQSFPTKSSNAKEAEAKASLLAAQLKSAGYQTEVKFMPNKAFKDLDGERQGEWKVYAWMKAYNPNPRKKAEPADPSESRQWMLVAKRQKKNKAEKEEWSKTIEQED